MMAGKSSWYNFKDDLEMKEFAGLMKDCLDGNGTSAAGAMIKTCGPYDTILEFFCV